MDYVISSGATRTLHLESGDRLQVLAGGQSLSSTINGAQAVVQGGGVAQGDVINDLGQEQVLSGGVAVSAAIDFGYLDISSGGRASAVVAHGAVIIVSAGGRASGTILYDAAPNSGLQDAQQDVAGFASGSIVAKNGTELVACRGRTYASLVASGGLEEVANGGFTSSDLTVSGGVFDLDAGARAAGVGVLGGGTLEIGAIQQGQTILLTSDALNSQTVLDGVTVASGGFIQVAADATVERGGTLQTTSGERAFIYLNVVGGRVLGPGTLEGNITASGGVLSGVILGADTDASFSSGTVGEHLTVTGGGGLQVFSSARIEQTTVSDGVAYIYSGANATGIKVEAGGALYMQAGGIARNLVLDLGTALQAYGGTLEGSVLDEGSITSAAIGLSAKIAVTSGASLDSSTLEDGTILTAEAGAACSSIMLAGSASIRDNGTLDLVGATAACLTELTGGGELSFGGNGALILSGSPATFRGELVDLGGLLEVAGSGRVAAASFAFDNSGEGQETLQLDTGAEPASGGLLKSALIDFSGVADGLDLRGVALVSGATARIVGSYLVLTDGDYTAKFRLSGSEASAYQVVSDRSGGTEITIRAAAGSVALLHAAAAFAPVSFRAAEVFRHEGQTARTALVGMPSLGRLVIKQEIV